MPNTQEQFEDLWDKFISEYGENYGSIYNGKQRRKLIAEYFFNTGANSVYEEMLQDIRTNLPGRLQ
ncbi:MAG: hypothetical protein ACXABK_06640 [Candidatus Heimdallarchaeaceae archaeon]|jgi:hypothetical protein